MALKNLIEAKQLLEQGVLGELIADATKFEESDKTNSIPQLLDGKVLAALFYEPSTRTRFSFETAMLKLGGEVISTESASHFSSVTKGETLEDTIKIIGGYADVIVMRHPDKGASKRAATVSPVPILNAGDGPGEHPSQALLDLYTIKKEIGRLDDFCIAMVGDLKNGRTIHSLVKILAERKNVLIKLVAPCELQLPGEYVKLLEEKKVKFEKLSDLDDALDADVVYMTRIQKERFESKEDYERVKDCFVFGKNELAKFNKNGIILHPLPRVNEISPEIDSDPRAAYFRQAKNGVYARMALLKMVLGK
ncbi:aspartate carbamoyltransferase [Candidatus Micrarchaeota archaeon]|nr:aspartate carbamoyltransferase [Candidatus Micrarchaeota archaeon]